MIKQETARAIYNCYSDIINSEKLLAEIEEVEKRIEEENTAAFNREDLGKDYNHYYELGVPRFIGSERNSSMRIFGVKPSMAKAIVIAHQANEKAILVELNQRARLELETEESDVTQKN